MGVFDLFSKRQKRARGEMPDVYAYDELPQPLRVQIVHIVSDAFGTDNYGSDQAEQAYEFVKQTLCREFGVFELVKFSKSDQESVFNFFLQDKSFKGANEEFLKAHEHYRRGRYKECLVDALKAFESTMKTIYSLRGWPTQPTDTAKRLISTCMSNGLFPAYFDSQFSSIRSLLESGVPTVRNKNGGHGQGTAPVAVPNTWLGMC